MRVLLPNGNRGGVWKTVILFCFFKSQNGRLDISTIGVHFLTSRPRLLLRILPGLPGGMECFFIFIFLFFFLPPPPFSFGSDSKYAFVNNELRKALSSRIGVCRHTLELVLFSN